MRLEQSFSVAAPVEQVWEALIDVQRIAPCLPGAEITGRDESGAYAGTFTVRLGPTTASYRGSLRMETLDAERHVATMSARGSDKRGQGGASATIVSTLSEEGGDTRVNVDTDFTITGRLARFGRGGMIEDISKRLMRDFAACLETTLGGSKVERGATGEPTNGLATSDVAGPGASAGERAPGAAAASPRASSAAAAPGVASPATSRGAASGPAARARPVGGFSLFFGALWDRLRRAVIARRTRQRR